MLVDPHGHSANIRKPREYAGEARGYPRHMRCELLFVRDERPGVLVLDCLVAEAGPSPTTCGTPCAIELTTPGRSLLDKVTVAAIRRWAATGAVSKVELRRSRDGGALRAHVRALDGGVAVVEPTRVVGVRLAA